jgi:hypothetical protein
MVATTKPFQLRQQTLEYLSYVVQKDEHGAELIAFVDQLVDELELVWEARDAAGLEAVRNKAEALAKKFV